MDAKSEKETSVNEHAHDWRVAEVEFVDTVSVRVFECWCGAAEMDTAA